MKIHLAWIRVTAVAAIAAGVSVQPAAAQYAPFRPAPPQPAAPQQAPVAPVAPYGAYRPQPTYPQTAYQQPAAQQPTYPQTRYQAPAMTYQAPVTPVAQQYQAPANTYRPAVAYPQTAMAQYPATYGGTPYVAQQQPTEVMPAPQQSTAPATTGGEAMPAGAMPPDPIAPTAGGAPTAGCNCGAGGYSAGSYYGAGGCGCTNGYPDVSGYMGDCGNENTWFGGIYFLSMTRENPSDARFTVQIDHNVAPNPYYPPQRTTIIESHDVDADFRSGVEVRFGSTFTVGESHAADCGCGSGYGYTGCGCNNSCSCKAPTTYGWEAAWWGLQDDQNTTVRSDDVTSNIRIYGMKNFAGVYYDRDGAGGAYSNRNANEYYGYQLPIPTPPSPSGNYAAVLAQRLYTDFKAQNLEINVIRFPACEVACGGGSGCNSGCGGSSCGGDACGGCNTGCGCDAPSSSFSMYGSCGVRYFRTDDDLSYDTEFAEWNTGAYDHPTYDGFSFDNSNELCYDINIDNNLIGPQFGWTTNYCVCCRWNLFMNSTFGVFDNYINQRQRMWSGGGGTVTLADGSDFDVHSHKNSVAFLGELRVGAAYDFTCHCRGVLAYRAMALTGIATAEGQIPTNFSSRAEVAQINADNSLIIHGVQTGVEFQY